MLMPDSPPKKLNKKHIAALEHFLSTFMQNRAGAWMSSHPKCTAGAAYRQMTLLLQTDAAKAFITSRLDEVLSNSSLKDLKGNLVARCSLLIGDPTTKPSDVARLVAALTNLLGWQQQTINLQEVPQLKVVIDDSPKQESGSTTPKTE